MFFESGSVHDITANLTEYILRITKICVPIREYSFPKASHPWLNDKCYDLVRRKHAAEGTPEYDTARDACTKGLLSEFHAHAERVKTKISGIPTSSKKWWKLCNTLMVKKNGNENIPPLRGDDGVWALTSVEKTNFVSTLFQRLLILG